MVEKMNDSDSNILARIDERTQAQTLAFAIHVKEDSERFEKVFELSRNGFEKIDKKLDDLWDEKNQRKGALSASRLISHGIWAIIVLAATYALPGK